MGAPWIDARAFADYLNARLISGVRFVPVNFTPVSGPYANQRCNGVNLIVTERNTLDSPEMGIELASALHKLYSANWKIEKMADLLANRQVYDAIAADDDPRSIAESWREELERFRDLRTKYLLYK